MPEFTKAPAGAFCWVELSTTDLDAAKKFYGGLFDWNLVDMPMGAGPPYVMASVGDKRTAGLMTQPPDAKKMGAPAHWLSYVAVDNADVAAKKATELGGRVLVSPVQMGPGKMAVLQDPTGGVFAVWQELESMGTFVYGENNSLAWNELSTTDVDRAGAFYAALFGWKLESSDMSGMTYTIFKRGDAQVGGMMPQGKEMAGAPSTWGVYFTVADADKAVAQATSLGGKVCVEPMEIPNVGRFAVLTDPQNVFFSMLQPKR